MITLQNAFKAGLKLLQQKSEQILEKQSQLFKSLQNNKQPVFQLQTIHSYQNLKYQKCDDKQILQNLHMYRLSSNKSSTNSEIIQESLLPKQKRTIQKLPVERRQKQISEELNDKSIKTKKETNKQTKQKSELQNIAKNDEVKINTDEQQVQYMSKLGAPSGMSAVKRKTKLNKQLKLNKNEQKASSSEKQDKILISELHDHYKELSENKVIYDVSTHSHMGDDINAISKLLAAQFPGNEASQAIEQEIIKQKESFRMRQIKKKELQLQLNLKEDINKSPNAIVMPAVKETKHMTMTVKKRYLKEQKKAEKARVKNIREQPYEHTTVMEKEVLHWLDPKQDKVYVDATFGGGGHTKAILEAEPNCRVIALEWDQVTYEKMLPMVEQKYDGRVTLLHKNFADLEFVLKKHSINSNDKVDGIVADFGTSRFQIMNKDGFSFMKNSPLDMRMSGQHLRKTAAIVLKSYTEKQLVKILEDYGEEAHAKRIAEAIVTYRKTSRITHSSQLTAIVESVVPKRGFNQKIHPATKTFQAIRIEVNEELANIQKLLYNSIKCLNEGGRIVCISFHSLEDNLVKNFIQASPAFMRPITKVLRPTDEEVQGNPSARSAKLRVAERIKDIFDY